MLIPVKELVDSGDGGTMNIWPGVHIQTRNPGMSLVKIYLSLCNAGCFNVFESAVHYLLESKWNKDRGTAVVLEVKRRK